MDALRRLCLLTVISVALPALAQSGLKPPERGEPGLDPSFARGWLAPEYDRFGFAARDAWGFAPNRRMQWSYSFSERGSLSMSFANLKESEYEPRPLSVFGRWWLSPDWAVSAESLSRDTTGLFRLQDFRIGVQRRF